jgi:hypothetical protein
METHHRGIHESVLRADYTDMRCLHCGKELALLKRWTGGGQFCSDAHKKSYQEEYNRIALSRLLQAQTKEGSTKAAVSSSVSPPAPVAVEEPVVEEPVLEEQLAEEPAAQELLAEEGSEENEVVAPAETREFLLERPAAPTPADVPLYVETSVESSEGPAVPQWLYEAGRPGLASAELLPLAVQPKGLANGHSSLAANLTPSAFANTPANPSLKLKITWTHALEPAGLVAIDIPLRNSDPKTDGDPGRMVGFEADLVFERPSLLELSPAGIGFAPEDSDVVIDDVVIDSETAVLDPVGPPESAAEAEEVEAGEALSSLHEDLARPEDRPAAPATTALPESVENEVSQPPEAPPEEPAVEQEAAPRGVRELLDLPIKMFAPPKPSLAALDAVLCQESALLPRLKGLPLRAKMAILPAESKPDSKAAPVKSPAAEAKSKPAGNAAPARVDLQVKAKPTVKPAPQPAAKAAQPAAKPAPAAKSTPAAKPAQPAPAPKFAPPVRPAQPAKPVEAARTAQPEPEPVKPAAAETVQKPAARKEPAVPKEPAAPRATELSPRESAVPGFGTQMGKPSAWGSLKVKLGIAIVLLVGACSIYLGWGAKAQKPAASTLADNAPTTSIMVGEGGWVEGWGGDPAGAHYGREITIYRPSLKLSDYRIEFLGGIETKSIGWVFRAADPDNYYAMKLALVSTGLSEKVALFKFLIAGGHQTQVGRVPIDMDVKSDTTFKIRVDVHGPQFSTYVQGQQVDVWTDDQLKSGGVGFLNERGERGRIKSASISYLPAGSK